MIKPIILFDGKCNLCAWSVQFILKHDKKDQFLFVSQQSIAGKTLMNEHSISQLDGETVILLEKEKVTNSSTAALRILKRLNGLWPATFIFIIIPRFMRDALYSIISKNRTKWFGRRETCYIPTKPYKHKFIDEGEI